MTRHNVFVSFHHGNDQSYRNQFESQFMASYDIAVSKSVQLSDIDPNQPTDRIRQIIRDGYIRTASVTVVLIGKETWKRKHVDWEIGSSIRATKHNPRCGLIGILLPSRADYYTDSYDAFTIPPRLERNIQCGYAKIYNWTTNYQLMKSWIEDAFNRRNTVQPDNSYPSFSNNRSGERWYE